MNETPAALALLRKQVAALLSQIDTATLPKPDKVHGPRAQHPGCEWAPQKGWRVFTLESADGAGMVYLDHACDDLNYRWGEPGDWEALRVEDARRIGLAFLAVAARAEEAFEGISRLHPPAPDGDQPADGEPAEVRTLARKRGRR